jgi:glycosyltransferase involved in cell wall biosynthesis
VLVVHNGADLSATPELHPVEAARRRLGIPPEALVLGFVGFVRAWHGVGWALEALADLPSNTHLLVVGDGPALDELQVRAATLGLGSRVHFTGRVPHDEVAPLSELIDVALQTAAVAYASPLKLFEYMARGRAIVAPDQANIREILANGENALLFDKDDEASFRHALHRLAQDQLLRQRLGANARRTIEQTPFTWEHNAETVAELAAQLSDA